MRTWFEWSNATLPDEVTLVVEVEFDTDPNAPDFRRDVIPTALMADSRGIPLRAKF